MAALCATVALAAVVDCAGGGPRCVGTNQTDTITGTDSHDEISALDGPDSVEGLGGPDTYFGGGSGDTLSENVGTGRDKMLGGRGVDFIDAANDESSGGKDDVNCGRGTNDSATVNANDDVRRCDGNVTVV